MTTFRGFPHLAMSLPSQHTLTCAVKRDSMNNLNVRKGERLMRSNFGCVIWDMLFEPSTDDAMLQ